MNPEPAGAMSFSMRALFATTILAAVLSAEICAAQTVTRAEALEIGESFVTHSWQAAPVHVRHGRDAAGVEIHTPDRDGGHAQPATAAWVVASLNIGVPYKWGGFDTPEKFDAGLKKGKAAGDLYTAEKRRMGGSAVSGDAVGIDCSGFVSRCWKLSQKHSTAMLAGICRKLPSPAGLQPGDVMNTANGHVLLFVKWLDAEKTRALFYEAAPFSKTLATEQDVAALAAAGYEPLRYRGMRE